MHDEDVERNAARDLQRRPGLAHRRLPPGVVGDRVGQRLAPVATDQAGRDGGVHAVERQPGLRQPAGEHANRRLVVVVKMRSGREHLDGFEPIRGDLREMVALEPAIVKEMCRDPEAHAGPAGLSANY